MSVGTHVDASVVSRTGEAIVTRTLQRLSHFSAGKKQLPDIGEPNSAELSDSACPYNFCCSCHIALSIVSISIRADYVRALS